jgi:hypothetical protein
VVYFKVIIALVNEERNQINKDKEVIDYFYFIKNSISIRLFIIIKKHLKSKKNQNKRKLETWTLVKNKIQNN